MEQISIEEKIKQKELEIIEKIQQLKKNEELGLLMLKNTCFCGRCSVKNTEWDFEVSKICIHEIIEYFGNMEDLVLEKLQKNTQYEL